MLEGRCYSGCFSVFLPICLCSNLIKHPRWFFTWVYGPTNEYGKKAFFNKLADIRDSFDGPCLYVSEFKYFLSNNEKRGGKVRALVCSINFWMIML